MHRVVLIVPTGVILLIAGLQSAGAMPPNPERPFNEKTCDDALRRLAEARAGSPLMPPNRNRQIAAEALSHARTICAAEGRRVTGD